MSNVVEVKFTSNDPVEAAKIHMQAVQLKVEEARAQLEALLDQLHAAQAAVERLRVAPTVADGK